MHSKMLKNQRGFTLTEVMIGMMVLTVAIVAATNLLISLTRANENNVKTLQAHYLAQEGIELVRNIRDTNWIHNRDWLGDSDGQKQLWGGSLEGEFSVDLLGAGWSVLGATTVDKFADLKSYLSVNIAEADRSIKKFNGYLSSEMGNGIDTGFVRNISVEPYSDNEKCALMNEEDVQCVLVTATVDWKVGVKEHSLNLQEVLTNWKGGAL